MLDDEKVSQSHGTNLQAGKNNRQTVIYQGIDQAHYDALFEKYTLTKAAVDRLWQLVQDNPDKNDDPARALDELAEKYKALLDQINDSQNNTDEARTYKNQARDALNAGDMAQAEHFLNLAALADIKALEEHAQSAAESYREAAELKVLEYDYLAAADYCEKAALLIPRSNPGSYGDYRLEQACNLNMAGYYQDSLSLEEEIVQLYETHFSEDDKLATALNNLARSYYNLGAYNKAGPLFLRALKIGEKSLGADHPFTARSSNNLATLYEETGRYEEAEPLFLRALEITEKSLGANHPDMATLSNNLAGLYEDTRRYKEAEPLYLRALEIGEKSLGADHPDMATWSNNLALFYQQTGRDAEAEPLFQRAIEISETSLGGTHPKTQQGAENFAVFLIERGRVEEARALLERFGLEGE